MKDKDRLARGLAARHAGRGWADIADAMSVSVPKAKALLAEPLADVRRKAAVAGGAHAPEVELCACGCPRDVHTRRYVSGKQVELDACSVCVKTGYEREVEGADDWGRWVDRCDWFHRPMTPEDHRQSHVARALSGGMSRSTLSAMYQLGINLVPNRYTRWRGSVPPVQTAKQKTQFKRAQKKLRREEARR